MGGSRVAGRKSFSRRCLQAGGAGILESFRTRRLAPTPGGWCRVGEAAWKSRGHEWNRSGRVVVGTRGGLGCPRRGVGSPGLTFEE